jgi:hypothetical protein
MKRLILHLIRVLIFWSRDVGEHFKKHGPLLERIHGSAARHSVVLRRGHKL